jgi:quercetin dioxygenase-like cupin family protein
MIEKKYEYTIGEDKTIERIVNTKFSAINHMILKHADGLPLHKANSDVHMIVVRGEISLKLNEQEVHSYPTGSILEIPYGTHMNVYNDGDEITEIFVVKAPAPEYYKELVEKV